MQGKTISFVCLLKHCFLEYCRALFLRVINFAIFGTSAKFVSPKINGNSIVTWMCINKLIVLHKYLKKTAV